MDTDGVRTYELRRALATIGWGDLPGCKEWVWRKRKLVCFTVTIILETPEPTRTYAHTHTHTHTYTYTYIGNAWRQRGRNIQIHLWRTHSLRSLTAEVSGKDVVWKFNLFGPQTGGAGLSAVWKRCSAGWGRCSAVWGLYG